MRKIMKENLKIGDNVQFVLEAAEEAVHYMHAKLIQSKMKLII